MEFVAVDVETANADMSSICQIGIGVYRDSSLVDEWKSYVDPEDFFDGMNVSIHGIDENTVKGAPILANVASDIYRFLDGRVSVCHTHFDRVSIHQAFSKYNLRIPRSTWLDSARVARRTWSECAERGYGLGKVCKLLGYEFTPHDALEDAKAAAQIIIAASAKTGLNLDGWLERVKGPISAAAEQPIQRDGNPGGALFGEVLVFTGALTIPRREAANIAAQIGCEVDDGVTSRTTLLVVGDQDVRKLAGHKKSTKHRKAERLVSEGQAIRILRESDFVRMTRLEDADDQ